MRPRAVGAAAPLMVLLATTACSGLSGNPAEAVTLELRLPTSLQVERSDTIRLSARALNQDGDSVAATIRWRTPDTTIAVDSASGRLAGLLQGATGRVQARSGSLISDILTFAVIPRADTLAITGVDTLRVLSGVTASGPLLAQLRSNDTTAGLGGRRLLYSITEPVFPDPAARTVELTGGGLTFSAGTLDDGTPDSVMVISRVGPANPDSAIVTVSAMHLSGLPVAGTGQRFVIRFDHP